MHLVSYRTEDDFELMAFDDDSPSVLRPTAHMNR